jgi:hypothetical protein
VLGVDLDASHDDIRQAYVDLALEHHPDRGQDGDPDTRRREWRMREVNAAWTVLRNPGRRAAYDRELRGERGAFEEGPARPRAPRTTPVRPAAGPQASSPSAIEVPARAAPWLRFGPLAVLLAVLAAIVVFTAYATQRDRDAVPGVEVETTPPYAEGSCVLLGSVAGRVTPVPVGDCATGGSYRVERVTDLGRPCPPPTETFAVSDQKLQLCLAPARP